MAGMFFIIAISAILFKTFRLCHKETHSGMEQFRRDQEEFRDAINRWREETESAQEGYQPTGYDEDRLKLEQRIANAEAELEYSCELRDKLMELLEMQELERDSCTKGSSYWQKYQRKVIALEGQLRSAQKRIDKAQWEKKICEEKMCA